MEDEERMARNVEIKAVARDFAGQQRLAVAMATDGPRPRLLVQHDVFYRAPRGRLKLRRFADGKGELIQYDRPDELGSKTCSYVVVPMERPGEVHMALSRALGVLTEVRKRRTLYMVGRTRVHFDEVEGLGQFIELEVVLEDGEDESVGHDEARELMARLGIGQEDLVAGAYADMRKLA